MLPVKAVRNISRQLAAFFIAFDEEVVDLWNAGMRLLSKNGWMTAGIMT